MVILNKGRIQPGPFKILVIVTFKEKTPPVAVYFRLNKEKAWNFQGGKTERTQILTSPHRPDDSILGILRLSHAPTILYSQGTNGLCGQSLLQMRFRVSSPAHCRFLPDQFRSGNHGLFYPAQI